jgi:hypothetical protein
MAGKGRQSDATPGGNPLPAARDLAAVVAALTASAHAARHPGTGAPALSAAELLETLTLLQWARAELAGLEPVLIAAARTAGVSWQALAPALGVASRQAAERRYLRGAAGPATHSGDTRDERVQAVRDQRAADRAVAAWANDNTADLRRLAGQITALTDLGDAAATDLAHLHHALGDTDGATLPGLLAATHQHLPGHPDLAAQVDAVTSHTDEIRQRHQGRARAHEN